MNNVWILAFSGEQERIYGPFSSIAVTPDVSDLLTGKRVLEWDGRQWRDADFVLIDRIIVQNGGWVPPWGTRGINRGDYGVE